MLATTTKNEIEIRKSKVAEIINAMITGAQAIQMHYGSLFVLENNTAYLKKFDAINEIIGQLEELGIAPPL